MTHEHMVLRVLSIFVWLALISIWNISYLLTTFPHVLSYFLTFGCIIRWAVNFGNLPLATLHLELKRLGQRHHSSSSCQWRGQMNLIYFLCTDFSPFGTWNGDPAVTSLFLWAVGHCRSGEWMEANWAAAGSWAAETRTAPASASFSVNLRP